MLITRNKAVTRTLGQVAGAAPAARAPGDPKDVYTPGHTEGYAPKDGSFLWDSWVNRRPDGTYTLFHLSAPADPNPETRHDRAQIRMATSNDLEHWTDKGFALKSGPAGSWDDGPIWTGCTRYENGKYYLFYTGRNHRDGMEQRIGLATSDDGVNWKRGDKPLLEPGGPWYETTQESPIVMAWRDPNVVKDPESGKYMMFFSAKTKGGEPGHKACIGLATADSIEGPYKLQPPVLSPGSYPQMECPQPIHKGGKWYLFFASGYDPAWGIQTGLHCFEAGSLAGPYKPVNGDGVVAGTDSNLYSTRLLPDPKRPGEYLAMGWFVHDRDVTEDPGLAHTARTTAVHAAAAAVPGPVGAALRIHEKAYTLSKPYPVVWGKDSVHIETGKNAVSSRA